MAGKAHEAQRGFKHLCLSVKCAAQGSTPCLPAEPELVGHGAFQACALVGALQLDCISALPLGCPFGLGPCHAMPPHHMRGRPCSSGTLSQSPQAIPCTPATSVVQVIDARGGGDLRGVGRAYISTCCAHDDLVAVGGFAGELAVRRLGSPDLACS